MQGTISRMKVDVDKAKLQKYRCSVFRFVLIVVMPFMLVACGAFRIQDKGRSEVAQQAVESSKEFSSGGSAVFGPMEQNLDSVRDTQEKLSEIAYKQAYELRKRIVASMCADDIAKKLVETMNERIKIIEEIETSQSETVRSINEQLDRQVSLTKILNESNNKDDFEKTVERVNNRLNWVEKIFTNASKLRESLKKESKDGKDEKTGEDGLSDLLLTRLNKDNTNNTSENKSESEKKDINKGKIIQDLLSKAKDTLKKIEKDEQVNTATKLLQQVGLECASIEQARLVEMKRHLGEIRRIKELIDSHDVNSVKVLFAPAIAHLLPVLSKEVKEEVKTLICKEIFKRYSLEWSDFEETKEREQYIKDCWADTKTLANYVVNDLKKYEESQKNVAKDESKNETDSNEIPNIEKEYIGKSPRLIGGFGIFVCYEREYFRNEQLLLARENHRYSIRLSKINAQQRVDIVNQLTQGLNIYYKGGIKPEEVAEIALLASQVGSLAFIGTQVH